MTVHNFSNWTNEDWRHQATVTGDNGEPRDLANAAAFLNVEKVNGTVALHLSLGNGLTISNEAEGKIDIEVPQTQMEAVTPGLYLYDLIVQLPDERINVLLGSIHLRQG